MSRCLFDSDGMVPGKKGACHWIARHQKYGWRGLRGGGYTVGLDIGQKRQVWGCGSNAQRGGHRGLWHMAESCSPIQIMVNAQF